MGIINLLTMKRLFAAACLAATSLAAKTAYEQARQQKGQTGATNFGFWINFAGDYRELVIVGFDFYNQCNLDYYMVAVGSNTQNPSGLANLLTNLAFRTFNGEDQSLANVATTMAAYVLDASNANATALGEAGGSLFSVILQVEIPTNSEVEMAYYP